LKNVSNIIRYNLLPDHTICREQETPRGKKRQKLRISVFLTVNGDGSDKRKAMVIGRAATPNAFKNAHINKNNLLVIYRNNKKAWVLSGIWYEYLRELNTEMEKNKRRIALATDNCPSHPPPDRPPKGYDGPEPPYLSHVTLVYLPKNTTPYFQPLDLLVHSIPSVSRQTWHPVITFCPSGNTLQQVTSPVRMEHKFDSLRERWDKRKGIKWLLTMI